ncbi:MAG TPA: TetR/AcrR family transcriptional regulator [Acidimicrobiales bacterium]|nr:TetR/AcrR family transcriptional regulator [Acidimicrobiales bacterium]
MTAPRTRSPRRRTGRGGRVSDVLGPAPPDGDSAPVERRAPYAERTRVGARGQQARQRILDAALQVFAEEGYPGCGIIRITELAGCSRAAFYQYFSSKEDVFRHLAGQVARELSASADALEPVSPDVEGWASLCAWIERHADIYARNQPVFEAFQAALESDEAVASGGLRIHRRHIALVRSKLTATSLPPRQLDAVIGLLLECLTRTQYLVGVLRAAMPDGAFPANRIHTALTDIVHRTLFGLDADVNVHPPAERPAPRIRTGPALVAGLQHGDVGAELSPAAARTRTTLLDAAHDVLVTRGYHGTRVDDIAAAAGLSHGAFYRYFENKEQVVRLLGVQALQAVSAALARVPDVAADGPPSSTALRQWLRRYNATHAAETAMIRVWVDAGTADPTFRLESAAALDWGRRRLVRFLAPRRFGDVDTDALLLLVLLDAFGASGRSPEVVDAVAHVIERGLLGRA